MAMDDGDSRVSEYGSAVVGSLVDVLEHELISIEQLAAMAGYSQRYCRKVLNRETSPTLQDIENLCEALGLRPQDVLGEIL